MSSPGKSIEEIERPVLFDTTLDLNGFESEAVLFTVRRIPVMRRFRFDCAPNASLCRAQRLLGPQVRQIQELCCPKNQRRRSLPSHESRCPRNETPRLPTGCEFARPRLERLLALQM